MVTDNAGVDGTDGSSIKPVSSLRSHFENIATTRPSASNTSSREGSPRLRSQPEDSLGATAWSPGRRSLDVIARDNIAAELRNGGDDSSHSKLRLPSQHATRNLSPIGSHATRPLSTDYSGSSISTCATSAASARPIQPPNQPSKNLPVNIQSGSAPSSTSNIQPHPPSTQPPRHLRIPSRPTTPYVDPRKSPFLSPAEVDDISSSPFFLTETAPKTALRPPHPPPINRADKPRVFDRTTLLSPTADERPNLVLPPAPGPAEEKISPFSTPPSGDESPQINSSPVPTRPLPPHGALASQRGPGSAATQSHVYPPPIHRSVINKRQPPDDNGTPGIEGGLPSRLEQPRPSLAADESASRPRLPPRREVSQEGQPSLSLGVKVDYNANRSGSELKIEQAHKTVGSSLHLPQPQQRNNLGYTGASPSGKPTSAQRNLVREVLPESRPINKPSAARLHPSTDDSDEQEQVGDGPVQSSSDYPDATQANRRWPNFQHGPREIHTKYDTKLFALCGEFVCTTGHLTRAWNLLSGELVMSLSHGETIKITSLAFKPALNLDDEGTRVWLGTNSGEVQEIDIPTQSIVVAKSTAHPRREVIKIHRHANEMWTLDDEGKLHVWPPDETGSPNLRNTHHTFRVPKGHTYSQVVRGQLWIASGKDVRVFQPSADANVQFQVLSKPLTQPGIGEVTCGATLGKRSEKVYFGHADGKVTIYSRDDYSCLGIVNVSLYKINSLAGVGNYLWAGFKTGMLYVYDTKTLPWTVRKDWHAHEHPVVNILADRSSIWKLDRVQVASLGAENTIRVWDGMLQADWLEMQMQAHDVEYCRFRELSALVFTWNAGASVPQSLKHDQQDSNVFQDLFRRQDPPDIMVFGFQELVDLEDKKVTAKSFFKSNKKKDSSEQEHMSRQYRAWRDYLTRCIEDCAPANEPYHLLHTASLVGLFTCIFVKESERKAIRSVDASEVKRGMGGLHGNKGALIVRFMFDDSSLCFVNCHLAAGQTQTVHRNNDIAAILETAALPAERDPAARTDLFVGGGDGTMILDHEICILNGDLNYRIDTMGRDTVVSAVKGANLDKLLERDQLLLSRRRNPGFRLRAFNECPITFAPTYKYDVGSDQYDSSEKRRAPAWCDRVLYRGIGRVKQLDYRRHEVRVSDHRPVSAAFKLRVKTISPKRRAQVWKQCERAFEEEKHRLATEAKLDLLVNDCGFDANRAARALREQGGSGRQGLSELMRRLETGPASA
ncbi:MAG: hypothetical protein M1833_000366 [Piccolia ochrophora]|nr:MAG: hypothetical protein M1833_000366 [Piccolia ochrophora]